MAGGVAVIALVLAYLLYRRLSRLKEDQRVILGPRGDSTDIIEFTSHLDARLEDLRDEISTLSLEARDHEVRIDGCLSRIGVVRFDAYQDLGGRQSTAIGLMNANDDGVVIATVVSRDFARTYVKIIKDGEADIPLAPEEEEALEEARARATAPFTIRPRPAPADKAAVEEAAAVPLVTELDSTETMARENRRRRRGLPAADGNGHDTALGWPKLEPVQPLEPSETQAFSPLDSLPEPEYGPEVEPVEAEPRRSGGRGRRFVLDDDDPFADL